MARDLFVVETGRQKSREMDGEFTTGELIPAQFACFGRYGTGSGRLQRRLRGSLVELVFATVLPVQNP